MKTKVTLRRTGNGGSLGGKNYRIDKFVGSTSVILGQEFFRVGDYINEHQAEAICEAYPLTTVTI